VDDHVVQASHPCPWRRATSASARPPTTRRPRRKRRRVARSAPLLRRPEPGISPQDRSVPAESQPARTEQRSRGRAIWPEGSTALPGSAASRREPRRQSRGEHVSSTPVSLFDGAEVGCSIRSRRLDQQPPISEICQTGRGMNGFHLPVAAGEQAGANREKAIPLPPGLVQHGCGAGQFDHVLGVVPLEFRNDGSAAIAAPQLRVTRTALNPDRVRTTIRSARAPARICTWARYTADKAAPPATDYTSNAPEEHGGRCRRVEVPSQVPQRRPGLPHAIRRLSPRRSIRLEYVRGLDDDAR